MDMFDFNLWVLISCVVGSIAYAIWKKIKEENDAEKWLRDTRSRAFDYMVEASMKSPPVDCSIEELERFHYEQNYKIELASKEIKSLSKSLDK